MKIYEIADTTEIPGVSFEQAKNQARSKYAELGSGFYGTVYKLSGSLERVMKIAAINSDDFADDAYFSYVKIIKDSQDANFNPYLPKIDHIIKVRPDQGRPYMRVYMERLVPAANVSLKSYSAALANLFGRPELTTQDIKVFADQSPDIGYDVFQQWQNQLNSPNVKPEIKVQIKQDFNFSHRSLFNEVVVKLIEQNGRFAKGYIVPAENKNWYSAILIVKSLIGQFNLDLHEENFMFRLTPYGAQLVITDPLTDL